MKKIHQRQDGDRGHITDSTQSGSASALEAVAWHYTTGACFKQIVETGYLLPSNGLVEPPEKGVLWFSTNQYFEPTACKMDRSFRLCSMEETMELGGGLVRFGVARSRLHPWKTICRKAKTPLQIRESLERVGREQGATPKEWYCTLKPVPVESCAIDVMENGIWVSVQKLG